MIQPKPREERSATQALTFGNPIHNSGGVLFYRDLEIPEPRWLAEGLVIEGGHHVFFGSTGHKKSFLVMDLALRIVNGMDFHGLATTPCEVIYVVGEGHAEFQKRQDAWLKYHNKSRKLISVMDPLYFTETSRFREFIRGVKDLGAALVIIDTLADSASGVRLIDNDDYNTVIKPLRKAINYETGAATIFVHHTGHDNKHESGARTIRNDAEGSFKVGQNDQGLTHLSRIKIRGADDSDKKPFLFFDKVKVDDTIVLTKTEPKPAKKVEKPVQKVNKIWEHLKKHGTSDRKEVAKALGMWREDKSCASSTFVSLEHRGIEAKLFKKDGKNLSLT